MTTYDAIVIGSGFGGSVAACRLSQAGFQVGLLERGKRYGAGHSPFPRDFGPPFAGWRWDDDQGLFDIKAFNEMFIVQSAGYGGGSLVYANVHARMQRDAFDAAWPQPYSRSMLDPYYDLVAHMLEIGPMPAALRNALPRTRHLSDAVDKMGRRDQFRYLNLAVNFKAHHTNRFGQAQQACQMCGECDIGCTYQAKNTLDLNYLAEATRRGTQVHTQHEVTRVVPRMGGYTVHFLDHTHGGVEGTMDAKYVFMCAGAVNSTELLLRNRDVHRTLPRVSQMLGHRYSGNGDFLAFAMNTQSAMVPHQGPTITSGIVFDRGTGPERRWFVFEDGGYPKQIANFLQAALNGGEVLEEGVNFVRDEIVDELKRVGPRHLAGTVGNLGDRSAVFLAMGRDRSNGRIKLSPVFNGLDIDWDLTSNMPLYSAQQRLSEDVSRALGGDLALTPLWKMLHQPVSVHNLGGCIMGTGPATGVVDTQGEVFGYPGLFVLDGAALPASTGVNPSHTIAAVAERNVEAMIRRVSDRPNWVADQRKDAVPFIEPLDSVIVPPGGTLEPQSPSLSLAFTETMRGHLMPGTGDFEACEKQGVIEQRTMQFTLTITLPDLDRFLAEKDHAGVAQGNVIVAGITPPDGVPVKGGLFNLFVQGDDPGERMMLYALPFTGIDGKPYLLDGFKEVRDNGHALDAWNTTTTLYTVIRQGTRRTDPVVATGILHVGKLDFAHQMTTFTVQGSDDGWTKIDALFRFGRMFMGSLWDVFFQHQADAA